MKLFDNATDGVNANFVPSNSPEPQALNAGNKGEVKEFRLRSPKEQEANALEKQSDIFAVQAFDSKDIDEPLDQNPEVASDEMEENEASLEEKSETKVKEKTFFFKNKESSNSSKMNEEKEISFEEVMMGFSGRGEIATQLTILPEVKVVVSSIGDNAVSDNSIKNLEEVELQEQVESQPEEVEQAEAVIVSDTSSDASLAVQDNVKMFSEGKEASQPILQKSTEKDEIKSVSFVDKESSSTEKASSQSQQNNQETQDSNPEGKELEIISDNLVEEIAIKSEAPKQKYEPKIEKDLKIFQNEKMVDGLIHQTNEDSSKKELLTSSFGQMEVKDLHLLQDDSIFEKESLLNIREDSLAMFSKILPGDFTEGIIIDSKPSVEEKQLSSIIENFGFLDLEEAHTILEALQNLIAKQAAKLIDAPEGTVVTEENLPYPFANSQLLVTKEQDGVAVNIESKISQFSNEVKMNETLKELPGVSDKNTRVFSEPRENKNLQTSNNSNNFKKPVLTSVIDNKKTITLRNTAAQLKHNGVDIKSLQVGNTLARFSKKSSNDSVEIVLKEDEDLLIQTENKNPAVQGALLASDKVAEVTSLVQTQATPMTDLSWVSDLIVERLDSMAFAIDMATGVQTVEMVMADSTDVPSVFLGAGLALEKEGNEINVSFHSFSNQAQEISAVQLVENGQAQLVELMKALGKRNLSLQGLRVGEHTVSLPQGTEDVITPFQFMEAALQHDLGEDRQQDSGKQDQEEEEPTLLEKEMI